MTTAPSNRPSKAAAANARDSRAGALLAPPQAARRANRSRHQRAIAARGRGAAADSSRRRCQADAAAPRMRRGLDGLHDGERAARDQTLKSSSLRPAPSAARSHFGCRPRPLQVSPVAASPILDRNLAALGFGNLGRRLLGIQIGDAQAIFGHHLLDLRHGIAARLFLYRFDPLFELGLLRQQVLEVRHERVSFASTESPPENGICGFYEGAPASRKSRGSAKP